MRIIARIDIKNNFVIKGINFEGLRKVGDPYELITKYYEQGIDEIIIQDSVASLYGRNNLFDFIKDITKEIFIPITLGGGIRSLLDIEKALKSGADKVAINTKALEDSNFIKEASNEFGSSTIVSSIETKKISDNFWEPYKFCGRERTNRNVVEWIKTIQENGCGEILLTSIDHEGTKQGFDLEMISSVYEIIEKPIIISGGCGSLNHFKEVYKDYKDEAVAIASVLHYKILEISDIKNIINEKNLHT
jgi:cyclase